MKILKEGGQEYAVGIDKALRRAARRAVLTAAATGTRLIIYEKGRIKRVRPPAKLNTAKKMQDMREELTGGSKDLSRMELKKLPQVRNNLEAPRAAGKHTAVAEERAKYRSR